MQLELGGSYGSAGDCLSRPRCSCSRHCRAPSQSEINPTAETEGLVRSEYKRIGREYLFTPKRIKYVLFACFASKRITGFYMRKNEWKRKWMFLSKQIFYLFRFKAHILKQNEANIFKENRLLTEAWDCERLSFIFWSNTKQKFASMRIYASQYPLVCKNLASEYSLECEIPLQFCEYSFQN